MALCRRAKEIVQRVKDETGYAPIDRADEAGVVVGYIAGRIVGKAVNMVEDLTGIQLDSEDRE